MLLNFFRIRVGNEGCNSNRALQSLGMHKTTLGTIHEQHGSPLISAFFFLMNLFEDI